MTNLNMGGECDVRHKLHPGPNQIVSKISLTEIFPAAAFNLCFN